MIDVINIAIAAIGVIISASLGFIIAIFGDDIRAKLRSPDLKISMNDLQGEWTVLTNNKTGRVIDHAIYFHALLINRKPVRMAKDVELFITECTITDITRSQATLPLPCPLPIQARREYGGRRHDKIDVGATPFAYDVMRCLKSERLEVLLNCTRPNNFTSWIQGRGTMSLVLEARGANAISNKIFVNIVWDGHFPEVSESLEAHIQITIKQS